METKTYVLSYNRYSGNIIKYSSENQAQQQEVPYVVIEADSFSEAKMKFREVYIETQTEGIE